MPSPAGTSISLLGVMLPQLSQQQAVEEGLGAWGLYLEALEKVPALLFLSTTCHSRPVLIEINGLLSRSLGRLFREWILMGRVQGLPSPRHIAVAEGNKIDKRP